jgi:hypothetical protein
MAPRLKSLTISSCVLSCMSVLMQTYLTFDDIKFCCMPAPIPKTPVGKYFIMLGVEPDIISIPIIISDREQDLYNACSPKNDFTSSLTFERGKPIECDIHGAEETIAAYVRLGTLVAYIPEIIRVKKKSAPPPWAARMFIHRGESYKNDYAYIPQPVYGFDRHLNEVFKDAIDWILVFRTDANNYASCEQRYKGVYVDVPTRMSIDKWDLNKIIARWGTNNLILPVK